MRSAAAFDDDASFGSGAPRKQSRKPAAKAGSKGSSTRKKKKKGGFFATFRAFDTGKVSKYAALGMSAAMVVGIMVNALMMQKGHHPAPLFGRAIEFGNPTPPSPRPRAQNTAKQDTAKVEAPAATPKAPPAAVESVPAPAPAPVERAAASGDPIGRLLATGTVPAQDRAERTSHTTAVGVQKALAKLGYDVKPNGTLGASSRKALEAFERGHHIPVGPDLSRRLVKALSSESGVHIE